MIVHTAQSLIAGVGGDDIAHDAQARNTPRAITPRPLIEPPLYVYDISRCCCCCCYITAAESGVISSDQSASE